MSSNAQPMLKEFNSLDPQEQIALYQAIARAMSAQNYESLSDEELTQIAAETFALLDEEESGARPR